MSKLPKTYADVSIEKFVIKSAPLYRCKLTCSIGRKACENVEIPSGIRKEDWIMYQMFRAIEELALHLEGQMK